MRKLNVLQFIVPTGFYGAEMWILALSKHLDREKVACSLAVTKESDAQSMELFDRFRSLGLPGHQIPMSGRFDLKVVPRLVNLIKANKIDILHSHGYKSDIIGLLAGRLAGVRVIATPHGFENAPDLKLKLFMKMGCSALKYVDNVAPLSQELLSDVRRIGVAPRRVRLIMNGVDLDEVEAERNNGGRKHKSDRGLKTIGYVGQIAFRKNVGDLIRAFDLLYREHQDVRLLLIGDGAQRAELEEMARSLPSSSRVEFLGYRKDRLALLKEVDVFSMTSSLEGIPRCMMEAMAMGVPIAAFKIPGVDNLVIHEKTGLLAEFGRVEALKTCWERLLFNGDLSSELAENGRRHILENFSAKRMADEYAALYEELAAANQN